MTDEHPKLQFGFFETRLDAIDKKLSVLDKLDKNVEAITKQHVADGKVLEGIASRQAEVGKAVDKVRCRLGSISFSLNDL